MNKHFVDMGGGHDSSTALKSVEGTLPTSESPSKQSKFNQTKRVTFEPLHDSSEDYQAKHEESQQRQESEPQEPTIVIDSSIDDRDVEAYRQLSDAPPIEDKLAMSGGMSNIMAALQSIRKQEEEEVGSGSKAKQVTIMTVEEEEALVRQINEIRERIRKGETVGQ